MQGTDGRSNQPRRPALRIRRRPAAAEPAIASDAPGDDWIAMLEQGRAAQGLAEFVEALCWTLHARGIPLSHCVVDLSGLHRQIGGYSCTWTRSDGLTVERAGAGTGARQTADSTLFTRLEHGSWVRAASPTPIPDGDATTGVLVLPRDGQGLDRPLVTLATQQPGGFSEEIVDRLQGGIAVIVAVLELMALRRIARRILKIYLGRNARRQILQGHTAHGAGDAVRAVIWVSDLRGFTRASDKVPAPLMIDLLNRALDGPINAIHAHGGEVVEIVGDGIIAMFPFDPSKAGDDPCARALDAAQAALDANDALLARTPPRSRLPRLPLGIALHVGDVFVGNVGNRDRVDFTVIGPAVNAASRMEKLTKALDRRLLLTADFVAASATPDRFESLGMHVLRGFDEPIEIHALAHSGRPPAA